MSSRAPTPRPSRRDLLSGAGALAACALASPALARNAVLALKPNSAEDQTARLQAALDAASPTGETIALPAGRFRVARLTLPDGAHLVGGPQSWLVAAGAGPVLTAARSTQLRLEGFGIDGDGKGAPEGALAALSDVAELELAGLRFANAAGTGLRLERCGGRVRDGRFGGLRVALHSSDAVGLTISGNHVRGCADNGILIWRGQKGPDGTQVSDNRIEAIAARSGGSGENGNAINIFRANGVIAARNVVRDAAFSAIRNNAGDDVQIIANQASAIGEVALYCEFGFTGGLVANNLVDGAAAGISCTNFDQKGRLAAISGNIVRNLFRRPDALSGAINRGIGIAAEADAALSGNVVEGAPAIGLALGYGPHLRDVLASGNLIRECSTGIGVSVAPGAGSAQIVDNFIADCQGGAVVGFAWERPVTGDLTRVGAERHSQLRVAGNLVR